MNVIHRIVSADYILEVFDDKVSISPKGLMKAFSLKGTKTIPFASINAIEFREAGSFIIGNLQFSVAGNDDKTIGENLFTFAKDKNAAAIQAKDFIESKMKEGRKPQSKMNISDDLQKLVQLRNQGDLSDEEFVAAKKKLMLG